MNKTTHDPEECIRNIFQLLVYKKKRIGFLFGAGTSKAEKVNGISPTIPVIKELTELIEGEILTDKDGAGNPTNKYNELVAILKTDLSDNYNIENMLSNLEQKHEIIGSNIINGLDKEDYQKLILRIKGIIKKKTSVHLCEKIEHNSLVQTDFATWIGQADRTFGIEVFTTNYDYLFELGLEHKNIPILTDLQVLINHFLILMLLNPLNIYKIKQNFGRYTVLLDGMSIKKRKK